MRKYELMTIIKPNLDGDDVDKVIARVEEMISSLGGNVYDIEKTGRKKLAYDIESFRDGFVAIQKIQLGPDKIKELRRQLKLNDNVMRIMLLEIEAAKTAKA